MLLFTSFLSFYASAEVLSVASSDVCEDKRDALCEFLSYGIEMDENQEEVFKKKCDGYVVCPADDEDIVVCEITHASVQFGNITFDKDINEFEDIFNTVNTMPDSSDSCGFPPVFFKGKTIEGTGRNRRLEEEKKGPPKRKDGCKDLNELLADEPWEPYIRFIGQTMSQIIGQGLSQSQRVEYIVPNNNQALNSGQGQFCGGQVQNLNGGVHEWTYLVGPPGAQPQDTLPPEDDLDVQPQDHPFPDP